MKKRKRPILALSIISVFLIALFVIEFNIYKTNMNQKKASAASVDKKTKSYKSPKKVDNKSKKTSTAASEMKVDETEKARQVAEAYVGTKDVGVYCIELNSGKSFGINQDKIYYAASTGKLPEILYTQKKINDGNVSVNTQFQYHDYVNDIPGAMIRGGTGVLKNNIRDGQVVSVGTLLKYACSYSDNLASNMLGYYVCDKNDGIFKNYISNILSKNITTFSKDFSAKDIALLMKSIYFQDGPAVDNLKNTDWDNVKIPKYLPVKVAHKIGINGSYNHDVAIVYAKDPYIISIMTKGESDEFIAQLSKKVYDELNNDVNLK